MTVNKDTLNYSIVFGWKQNEFPTQYFPPDNHRGDKTPPIQRKYFWSHWAKWSSLKTERNTMQDSKHYQKTNNHQLISYLTDLSTYASQN